MLTLSEAEERLGGGDGIDKTASIINGTTDFRIDNQCSERPIDEPILIITSIIIDDSGFGECWEKGVAPHLAPLLRLDAGWNPGGVDVLRLDGASGTDRLVEGPQSCRERDVGSIVSALRLGAVLILLLVAGGLVVQGFANGSFRGRFGSLFSGKVTPSTSCQRVANAFEVCMGVLKTGRLFTSASSLPPANVGQSAAADVAANATLGALWVKACWYLIF